jgi:hypothetical protein
MEMPTSSSAKTNQPQQQQPLQHTQQDNKKPEERETMTLSEAASIMRNENASPEERSRAASIMGREGGKHSHDHDRDRGDESRRRKASGA